jgi:cytoskeletal protein CcmA (bactofilin family)
MAANVFEKDFRQFNKPGKWSKGSRALPSIVGEGLTIRGKVTAGGAVQVDGQIEGEVRCSSLLLSEPSHITGIIVAEEVVVRGKVLGTIKGLHVTLQDKCHVEGDIYYQSLVIEQGAYFEGKSRRCQDPFLT